MAKRRITAPAATLDKAERQKQDANELRALEKYLAGLKGTANGLHSIKLAETQIGLVRAALAAYAAALEVTAIQFEREAGIKP